MHDLPKYHHLYRLHLWNHIVRTTNNHKDTYLLSLHQDRVADMAEDLLHNILFFLYLFNHSLNPLFTVHMNYTNFIIFLKIKQQL